MKARITILFVLFVLGRDASRAQGSLWTRFDTTISEPTQARLLSRADTRAMRAMLWPIRDNELETCTDRDSWPLVTFQGERLAVSTSHRVTLMHAYCGGDPLVEEVGIWPVLWHGGRPQILIEPNKVYCWFHRVQPNISHGFHDFTMFCHHSAYATDYAWYRFDGYLYRRIGVACAYKRSPEGEQQMQDEQKRGWAKEGGCEQILYSPNDRPD